MKKNIKILAIAGSLRKKSYNRWLLKNALELSPPNCQLEIFDLLDIPLYNQDDEANLPLSVAKFKTKIQEADAILIATPEYNYSISGVLKNALDWGSRPYGDNSWNNKPVGIVGASIGLLGTARAQYHLRQVFVNLNMHPLNRPELMISSAQDKFDDKGNLNDPIARQKLTELLIALISSTTKD